MLGCHIEELNLSVGEEGTLHSTLVDTGLDNTGLLNSSLGTSTLHGIMLPVSFPLHTESHAVRFMIAQRLIDSGRWLVLIGFSVLFLLVALVSHHAKSYGSDGASALLGPGWSQKTVSGELCEWDPSAKAHVICILGCECPVARFYASRLELLSKEYESRGVRFIAVMGLIQDDVAKIQGFIRDSEISFPVVRDDKQTHLENLRATRTPEVFVLDQHGKVVYRGRIDDQMAPGVKRNQPSTHELTDALDAVLADRPVASPVTAASGCLIALQKKASGANASQGASDGDASIPITTSPTYAADIAGVFYKHCYDCHR
ncbi:MAG: redoxin domain-containing protein, partial [Pirellula sp.]|nr:redoxin domain-containing protein [Pirellula sp.]